MTPSMKRTSAAFLRSCVLTLLAMCMAATLVAQPAPNPPDVAFFEQKVRPLLVEQCYRCHSEQASAAKGGLRLDTRDAVLKGGGRGPALIPGQPGKGLLMRAVEYKDPALKMPPD